MDKIKIFPDWEKKIRDNKELFIDSIIDRYGEENRELLSKKFDETKLIFFETPKRLKKYIEAQTKEELIIETLKFLEEIGIDTSTIYEENDFLLSSDPITNKKLELLFGESGRFSTDSIPDTILEFSSKEKKKTEMHSFCRSFLKKYSLDDYQLYNQSPEKILDKYKSISKLAITHLQRVFGKYYYVTEYQKELKLKESKMKFKSIDDKINLYIINGSIDKKTPMCEKEEILSVIKTRKANFSHCDILSNTNVLFLSPYCSNSRTFDRILDHEYTHSLESSVYRSQNGTLIFKCGMRIVIYDEFNNPIEEKYRKINEAVTHLISIQSTLKRYSNKQYIFADPKNDISKIGASSSCYDKNLPKAIALVMALPKDFIKRRIENTVDFIYDYFDENTWDELEEMIDDDNISLEEFTNYINNKKRYKTMIKRFEYVMNDVFDDKIIIIIEKNGNDYYFSNNQLKNKRVNNEKTLEFINELLISLNSYKRKTKIIILDEPTGYINILKDNGEILYYSSEDYLFGMIDDILSDFEENVLKRNKIK